MPLKEMVDERVVTSVGEEVTSASKYLQLGEDGEKAESRGAWLEGLDEEKR